MGSAQLENNLNSAAYEAGKTSEYFQIRWSVDAKILGHINIEPILSGNSSSGLKLGR